MRILVTGSRDWSNRFIVGDALVWAYQTGTDVLSEKPTVVTGGCASGADRMAAEWATAWGWKIEVHPADWIGKGRAAGPIRNQQMVDLGADVCLAFIRGGSRGATHCANAAERAGITTHRYTE